MRKTMVSLLAGASFVAMNSLAVQAQELTILWAEWDPASYLQELVNEYQAETGVTVTVETVPWPDFQTKLFTELNAQGSAYDLVVGDSQFLGAASTGGHYVNLTDFATEHEPDQDDGSGHHGLLFGISGWFGPVLVGAAGRRRSGLGLP